jgi:hypothetical protein
VDELAAALNSGGADEQIEAINLFAKVGTAGRDSSRRYLSCAAVTWVAGLAGALPKTAACAYHDLAKRP